MEKPLGPHSHTPAGRAPAPPHGKFAARSEFVKAEVVRDICHSWRLLFSAQLKTEVRFCLSVVAFSVANLAHLPQLL